MKSDEEVRGLLLTASSSGGVALVVGVFRLIIEEKYGSVRTFFRGVSSSILVGVSIGSAIEGYTIPLAAKMAIVSVCAYLADDLLAGIAVIGGLFRKDPVGFAFKILDSVRGKSQEKEKS